MEYLLKIFPVCGSKVLRRIWKLPHASHTAVVHYTAGLHSLFKQVLLRSYKTALRCVRTLSLGSALLYLCLLQHRNLRFTRKDNWMHQIWSQLFGWSHSNSILYSYYLSAPIVECVSNNISTVTSRWWPSDKSFMKQFTGLTMDQSGHNVATLLTDRWIDKLVSLSIPLGSSTCKFVVKYNVTFPRLRHPVMLGWES